MSRQIVRHRLFRDIATSHGCRGDRQPRGCGGIAATDVVDAAYEQIRRDAIAADVFGSPAYVLDGEIFWGQDRLELLADALKSGRSAYTCKV